MGFIGVGNTGVENVEYLRQVAHSFITIYVSYAPSSIAPQSLRVSILHADAHMVDFTELTPEDWLREVRRIEEERDPPFRIHPSWLDRVLTYLPHNGAEASWRDREHTQVDNEEELMRRIMGLIDLRSEEDAAVGDVFFGEPRFAAQLLHRLFQASAELLEHKEEKTNRSRVPM